MTISTPISIVILAHNEVTNLASCLDSLRGVSDDVHLVDSGSTDGTVQLAKQRGVTVHAHAFTGFGSQRNWAIDHVPHKYPWIFHLDADEQFTPELAREIAERISSGGNEAAYFVPNKLMLCGRWLKHAGGYPTYQVRLFRHGQLRFMDHGHGQREVTDGEVGYLGQPYLHHAFSKGIDDWIAKHAGYARLEAEQYMSANGKCTSTVSELFSRDPIRRRRTLKRITAALPMRSVLRMMLVLFVQRGVLDGRAGLTYARLMATYESMIAVHIGLLRAGMDADGRRPGAAPTAEKGVSQHSAQSADSH